MEAAPSSARVTKVTKLNFKRQSERKSFLRKNLRHWLKKIRVILLRSLCWSKQTNNGNLELIWCQNNLINRRLKTCLQTNLNYTQRVGNSNLAQWQIRLWQALIKTLNSKKIRRTNLPITNFETTNWPVVHFRTRWPRLFQLWRSLIIRLRNRSFNILKS
jgi:hypothetical protein